jgi:hypothetical protein
MSSKYKPSPMHVGDPAAVVEQDHQPRNLEVVVRAETQEGL